MAALLHPPLGEDDHVRGDLAAPFHLLMYGDFECPFCQGAQGVLRRVRDRLGDELVVGFRHFPIEQRHPRAHAAAVAVESAAAQGRFWEMHDALFAARGRLSDRDLRSIAAGVEGVDANRVMEDVAAGAFAERIARDVASGQASGVAGTPAFYAGEQAVEGSYDARSLTEALRASRG